MFVAFFGKNRIFEKLVDQRFKSKFWVPIVKTGFVKAI